ncbi:MAG: SIMPL domain-containing protein [Myxococcota bacterium]
MRLPAPLLLLATALVATTVPLALRSANGAEPTPAGTAASAGVRPFPTVSVSGTTELAVAPDEAWIHLRVESFFATMESSVADNDKRMSSILTTLKAAGIAPADLATEAMTLAETDHYEDGQKKIHGWQISRSLTARVRDLDKLERLLQSVIKAGATNIDGVRFAHSQINDKKAEARASAMKAARDKAELMASALGQHVGKALTIREGGAGAVPFATNVYANEVLNQGGTPLSGETIAAGRIRVEVSVDVEFELL